MKLFPEPRTVPPIATAYHSVVALDTPLVNSVTDPVPHLLPPALVGTAGSAQMVSVTAFENRDAVQFPFNKQRYWLPVVSVVVFSCNVAEFSPVRLLKLVPLLVLTCHWY